MKLEKKKNLAARTLKVGIGRVIFNQNRIDEIKQAITKQDIRDLKSSGAILIKETKGKKKKVKRKTRRRAGSIKKKPREKRKEYMFLTRKLRAFLRTLKSRGKLTAEQFQMLRRETRTRAFRSLFHLKERIQQMKEQI